MTRFIALLRGINVGKGNRVPMAELRRIVTEAGGANVATLLQSGNAVFDATESGETVAERIEAGLTKELGVTVPLIVRTVPQLAAAIDADPLGDVATNPKMHLLGFFSDVPSAASKKQLDELISKQQAKGGKDAEDQYKIVRDHVYLWCASSVHESIFASVKWDKVLGVTVTMRNWDTVTKLLTLAG